jgi:hypothetical protein
LREDRRGAGGGTAGASMARMRRFVVSILVLVVLGSGGAVVRAAAGAADEGRRDPAYFRFEAVALHADGWTVGDLVYEGEPGATDVDRRVWLVLVDPTRTRALRCRLDFAAGREAMTGYRRELVRVPAERLVYDEEGDFFDGLAHGASPLAYDDMGVGVLALAGAGAYLSENGWHVVRRRVEGAAAGAALTEELRVRLRRAHVAELRTSPASLVFVLKTDEAPRRVGLIVVEAHLDAQGAIVATEVQELGDPWMPGRLEGERALVRALRGRTIRRVSFTTEARATRVRLHFDRGRALDVDADIVYPGDEGCGC